MPHPTSQPGPAVRRTDHVRAHGRPTFGHIDAQRQITALRTAPACPGAVDCRQIVNTTIADITNHSKTTEIRIDSPAVAAGDYDYSNSDGIVTEVVVGDAITAEIWHGQVVALRDSGGRADTDASPLRTANKTLTLAIALAAIALALLMKYVTRATALAVVPPEPKAQWRIDLRSPGSVAYNGTLFVAVAAVSDVAFQLKAGGVMPPLIWLAFMTPTIAIAIIANTAYGDRRPRIAAGIVRPKNMLARRVLACVLLIIAAGAMVLTIAAANSYHDLLDQKRIATQAQGAPVCAGSVTVDCIRNEAVGVDFVYKSNDESAVYISQSSLAPQWVYFSADDEAFVESLANSQAIVAVYDDKIIAVSRMDGSPVPTYWTADPDDYAALSIVGAAAPIAIVIGAFALGWHRPGFGRIVASIVILIYALVKIYAGTAWAAYLPVAGFVLICWPELLRFRYRPTTSAETPELLPARRP